MKWLLFVMTTNWFGVNTTVMEFNRYTDCEAAALQAVVYAPKHVTVRSWCEARG